MHMVRLRVSGCLLLGAMLQAAIIDNAIVFVCGRDGADNICVTDSTHSFERQLTMSSGTATSYGSPRWSHDRKKIAFHLQTGRTKIDVYAMNGDGSAVRKLTDSDGSAQYRNPAWAPDGSRLALECRMENVWEVCLVNSDGSGLRRLTPHRPDGRSSQSPDWSPDGKWIAFHSNRDAKLDGAPAYSGTDIYLMDTEGSSITRLTETLPGRLTQNPAWSPDGKMIAFNSTRDGDSIATDWEIYVMNSDGTGIRRLTHDKKPDGHPRWSPDGQSLIFHSNRDGLEGKADEVELYVIGVDGKNLRRITNNAAYDGFADW